MAGSRLNSAPFGARIIRASSLSSRADRSANRTRLRGSMLKVLMIDGYRLLKSNTNTLS